MPGGSGTSIAFEEGVDIDHLRETSCPECGAQSDVHPDSSPAVGWYTCPNCGCEWSARWRGASIASVIVTRHAGGRPPFLES